MGFIFSSVLVLFIYRAWFNINNTLSSGDWPYLFLENIKEFSFLPQAGFLWLTPYYQISAKFFVEYLGISWAFSERILWFWPFILLSIISSFYLTRSWLGVIIYTTNTYVLMLGGGGQMGVAITYSLAPLVLARFIKLIDSYRMLFSLKSALLMGLVLAVLFMFDPRIGYILFIAIFLYYLINNDKLFQSLRVFLSSLTFLLIIPIGIAILLNSFWIMPSLFIGFPALDKNFSSLEGFKYYSFADFSHAFSLLHPNWPENIFGKIYFLQPEFLLLPVFAYLSLFFLRLNTKSSEEQYKKQRRMLFFALIGLTGIFLAKGANPPFGELNSILFQKIPGMNMFRDSTKFYLLIALSYSVLIPFSVQSINDWFSSKFKIPVRFGTKFQSSKLELGIKKYLFLLIFLSYWAFLIRPAFLGQLGGTFKQHEIPNEYILLKDFLQKQPAFFQTLWIPSVQRFGFNSSTHPAISGTDYFAVNSISKVIEEINKPSAEKMLRNSSIKYIIVPFDSQKELFTTDRKFDQDLYRKTIKELEVISWIRKRGNFGNIVAFDVPDSRANNESSKSNSSASQWIILGISTSVVSLIIVLSLFIFIKGRREVMPTNL